MILPLSINPAAPGQGALAIEIKSKEKKIIADTKINKIDLQVIK